MNYSITINEKFLNETQRMLIEECKNKCYYYNLKRRLKTFRMRNKVNFRDNFLKKEKRIKLRIK